ncbi:hypothetical protein H7J06_22925 [Mycobacterium hodleri]|uniref:hypothetical protein n=1 Tax=Mycolicibacterium hodleri TaxID=49897 RepID=UPI0021F254ED|nr:hypothetical protein [Mycolicibacterium hodleri]MCV7135833.1 hypothetical protein [Mycolicibacterium hodleri]
MTFETSLRRRVEQVRRRWWVVLVIAGLAAVSALPLLNVTPTYAATSTLVLSSPNRNPLEDATMITGYSTLFNDPATVGRLRTTFDVPPDVTFEARMVGASPILTIEAIAKDPKVAQEAALRMAEAFTQDINSVRQRRNDNAIRDTQRQLDALMAQPGPSGVLNPLAPVLQQRLDVLRADSTDQMQELQPRGGVTEIASKAKIELLMRVGGGVLLGVLAALALAAVSTRLENSGDLRDKTGVDALADLPAGDTLEESRVRETRLHGLVNVVSLQDLPKATVVAVTDARGAGGARELAEALATLSARQGSRTVLVYADDEASPAIEDIGFNDALVDPGVVGSALRDGPVESLRIMPVGSGVDDRCSRVSRDRVTAVVDELRTDADTIVVSVPPITESVDAQPICAAADRTILVVDKRWSRASGVTAAVDALAGVRAVLLGAVLVGGSRRGRLGKLRRVDLDARPEFESTTGGPG